MGRRKTSLLSDLLQFLPSKTSTNWEKLPSVHPNQPVVILVSGFAASHRTLSVIRKRLLRDGFNVVVLSMDWDTLSDCVRGLYRMAEKLSTIVLQLKKTEGLRENKFFLVAHSAGGLVARYYIQLLGGFHYCDGLVTLATPHRGTWLAVLGFFSHLILKARVLFQMLPISPFIRSLNHTPLPSDFRIVSIYSREDPLCHPKVTEFANSSLSQIENLELRHVSHHDLLLSRKVYRLLLGYLRPEEPGAMKMMTE